MHPTIIPRPEHRVSRSLLDREVLHVLYRLKDLGHQAYVVGGAVRDILRGLKPKDFDVATDATPSELRRIFRNSRIVGRRFRIVHVIFGDKMIEVATLRREADRDEDPGEEPAEDVYIEDDNQWGDVESDAFRRDFTCNALFYDIRDFSLIDWVGGVSDIEAGVIRAIGDPERRFREDPVRMLRAIKFAARFGYTIEPATDAAIRRLPEEIHNASRFRVTEEVFRILSQANRRRGFEMLVEYGFIATLFPSWSEAVGDEGLHQIHDFLAAVDSEAAEGRYLPLEVLAAGLFLPLLDAIDPVRDQYHDHAERVASELSRLTREMDLPKRLSVAALALLKGQLYLLFFAHRQKQLRRFVERPEFDWIWRLHDLAFGEEPRLHGLQEAWLHARERLGRPIDGWSDSPDRRDIFSFRGRTGGGRHMADEAITVIEQAQAQGGGGGRRRRRRH